MTASGAYVTPLVRKLAAEHGVDLAASPAPASAAGSASRTCSPRPRRPAAPRRPRPPAAARPPRTPSPAATPRHARCAAAPRSCPGCARSSPGGWSSRCRSAAQLTTVVEVDVTRIAKLRAAGQGGLRGPRGRQAVVPAVLRPGRRRGAEGAPDGERLDRPGGRHGHLPRRRAPRHRGGHRARPARAGHPRRRRPQPRRHRPQDRRPGRAHPHQQDHARTSWAAAPSR